MNNKEFLQWVYERLVYVHRESSSVDYMRKFRDIIEASEEGSPVAWLLNGRVYSVQQRDDAGFGDYCENQTPLSAEELRMLYNNIEKKLEFQEAILAGEGILISENEKLKAFINKAFEARPNLDMDIEFHEKYKVKQ